MRPGGADGGLPHLPALRVARTRRNAIRPCRCIVVTALLPPLRATRCALAVRRAGGVRAACGGVVPARVQRVRRTKRNEGMRQNRGRTPAEHRQTPAFHHAGRTAPPTAASATAVSPERTSDRRLTLWPHRNGPCSLAIGGLQGPISPGRKSDSALTQCPRDIGAHRAAEVSEGQPLYERGFLTPPSDRVAGGARGRVDAKAGDAAAGDGLAGLAARATGTPRRAARAARGRWWGGFQKADRLEQAPGAAWSRQRMPSRSA